MALILTVESESVGNGLIDKILPLVNASFDASKVSVSQSRKTFPAVPGTQEILGKAYRKPRERPITQVRFVRAECHIHGKPKPVILIDRTGKYDGLAQNTSRFFGSFSNGDWYIMLPNAIPKS